MCIYYFKNYFENNQNQMIFLSGGKNIQFGYTTYEKQFSYNMKNLETSQRY